MRGYFSAGQISQEEKSNILSQHKSIYDGYQTMLPKIENSQPLYVQDFANDKGGIVVNNKGEVKPYTNVGINENVEEKQMCSECGGKIMEGECTECGHQYENMDEGECNECGEMEENIYDVKDLNKKNKFDYVSETEMNELGTDELKKGGKYKLKTPSIEDELEFDFETDDKTAGDKMYKFKGKHHGSHLLPKKHIEDFVDVSDYEDYEMMESAWEDEMDEVDVSGSQGIYSSMKEPYDFDSEGPGSAGPYQTSVYETEMDEEKMENPCWDGYEMVGTKMKNGKEVPRCVPKPKKANEEWSEVDEDIQESFLLQKKMIFEMMNRMKVIK